MKLLKQIRYVLFAFMVIGCFANFAQNEYGLAIFYHTGSLVGFTLLIDAFAAFNNFKLNKLLTIYLFAESFLLGTLFISFDSKMYMHLPFSAAALVFSGGGIILLYFILSFILLIKDSKKNIWLAITLFFIVIDTICAIAYFVFKILHWPFAGDLLWISFTITIMQYVGILLRRKFTYNGEKIKGHTRLKSIPGKLIMSYIYFSIWVVYTGLIIFKIAPDFYFLNVPPVVQKMYEANDPRVFTYKNNYNLFLDNRLEAKDKE